MISTGLHHIGYWVDDLDAAMRQWSQDLGVGPFQVIEHVPFDSFVLTVDGQSYDDVAFDHSAAFQAVGEVAVRDVLRRALIQFQNPQTGVVTMTNTLRWVAGRPAGR